MAVARLGHRHPLLPPVHLPVRAGCRGGDRRGRNGL